MNKKSITKKSMERDIDFSDIPETDEAFWADAQVEIPSGKTAISIRVDNDVLSFFKKQGKGYQARMNAVLKSYVNHAIQ